MCVQEGKIRFATMTESINETEQWTWVQQLGLTSHIDIRFIIHALNPGVE